MSLFNIPCLLLAGGCGTRLGPVVNDRPKPMAQVAGRPFIEWVMDYFAGQGITRFVISAGYMAQYIARWLEERPEDDKDIALVTEDAPLGTGGAIRCAAEALPGVEAFITANADSLLLADLAPALEWLSRPHADAVIIGRRVADASRYGSLKVNADGLLEGFAEKAQGSGLINGGVYIFKPRILSLLPKHVPMSIERDGFPALIEAGARVYVHTADAPFLDIGVPEAYAAAEEFVKKELSEDLGRANDV